VTALMAFAHLLLPESLPLNLFLPGVFEFPHSFLSDFLS